MILDNTDENLERERAMISTLQEKRVNGLIVVPASSNPASHLEELIREGTARVLVDRNIKGCAIDAVIVDNENGTY